VLVLKGAPRPGGLPTDLQALLQMASPIDWTLDSPDPSAVPRQGGRAWHRAVAAASSRPDGPAALDVLRQVLSMQRRVDFAKRLAGGFVLGMQALLEVPPVPDAASRMMAQARLTSTPAAPQRVVAAELREAKAQGGACRDARILRGAHPPRVLPAPAPRRLCLDWAFVFLATTGLSSLNCRIIAR
jgi:hypothetical protein